MIPFIPLDVVWIIPAYWEIPIPFIWGTIWIGQFYNVWLILFWIWIFFTHRKNMLYFANWLFKKNNLINLWGKTWSWKTRLLSKVAMETHGKDNNIVIGNFFDDNIDMYFASFDDFCMLQADVALLALHTNFSKDKIVKDKILKHFVWYFDFGENTHKIKKIKWLWNIITLWDEFYAYLHNRSFMSNFAKAEWKKLLLDLHQTRHHNQTIILASQDTDNLDLDLRQLAHQELEVKSYFLDLFYGFNIYKYLTKKEQTEIWKEFKKLNRIPYLFINYYELNKMVERTYNNCRYIGFIFKNIIPILKKQKLNTKFEQKTYWFFSKNILPYHTKFDIRIDKSIYKPWMLFDYILEKEKQIELDNIKKYNTISMN